MDFETFKAQYLKVPVIEYPNKRQGKAPLVTVRLLSYNHANYVRQCLDGVLAQKTNFDFEILIAEDESNDGTREICIEYAEKYPEKIRLLLNARENNIPINGKPSGLFNSVYSNFMIQSKYIALCETDDFWIDENSLQKRADVLENRNEIAFCYHRVNWFYQETQTFKRALPLMHKASHKIEAQDILSIDMPTCTIMYRNILIEKFDEQMKETLCGDTILRGKLGQFGAAWFCNNIIPSVYRIHNQGCYGVTSYENRFIHLLKAIKYLINYFEKRNQPTAHLEKALATSYLYFFIHCFWKDKKIRLELFQKSKYHAKQCNLNFPLWSLDTFKQMLNIFKTKIMVLTRN
jgi:glycosyltransferase involved in cell wall biosynthesis